MKLFSTYRSLGLIVYPELYRRASETLQRSNEKIICLCRTKRLANLPY